MAEYPSKSFRSPSISLLAGLAGLVGRYEALLCDVWGVVHNGVRIWPEALEALIRFRAGGGVVLLLSNAPRPGEEVRAQLVAMGFPNEAIDGLLTSGDAVRVALEKQLYGPVFWHIGPARDVPLMAGLPFRQAATSEEASFIVCSGLYDDTKETPDDYKASFGPLIKRDIPMVCANPDLIVERGDEIIYCAGALAALYETMGGRVIYFGKPHAPIYETALARVAYLAGARGLAAPDKTRVLAVGDGMITDMRGAHAQGLDALFITGGILADELGETPLTPDPQRLADLCAQEGVQPIGALARLVW
ncbi:MAG: TIGR01459 family HAD-type hydrolase [Parvularculales bacterium]